MQEYVLMNFYDSSEKSKKVNALFEQVEAAFTKTQKDRKVGFGSADVHYVRDQTLFQGCELPCILFLSFIPEGDRTETLIKVPVFTYNELESDAANLDRLLSIVEYQTAPWILELKSCQMIDHTPTPALVYFKQMSGAALEATLRKVLVSQRFAYGSEEPIYFFYVSEELECSSNAEPFGLYLVHTDSAEPLSMPAAENSNFYQVNRWISLSAVQFTHRWGKRANDAIYKYEAHALVYFFNSEVLSESLVKIIFDASAKIANSNMLAITLITPFEQEYVPGSIIDSPKAEGLDQLSTMMGVTEAEVPSLWFIYS